MGAALLVSLGLLLAAPELARPSGSSPAPATPPPSLSAPSPAATPGPLPTPPLGTASRVRVTSIPGLLAALGDDAITEIVVADGTYTISPAALRRRDSLWIGARYADRTRPITVRAETTGGVTFDGGGARYFGGLSFVAGAHHQTWDGFVFANGTPTQTGVITFGGAGDRYVGLVAPHHITLRDIAIAGSVTTTSEGSGDHGVYFSQAVGGPHDILVDGLAVDGSGGLDSAVTFFHSDQRHRNAWNVTVRRLAVNGTNQAIEVWDETVTNLVIEDSTIKDAERFAVRYEAGEVTLRRVTSTGSGERGFYSSTGRRPPGVTFVDCVLR